MMRRLLALAIVAVVSLTSGSDARGVAGTHVHLPLIGRSHALMPGRVSQITVRARLARYKPRSATCDLLAGPVIDHAAHIRILDAETGAVLQRGRGTAEAVVYAAMGSPGDTGFAYGISFDPAVAPRRLCPNLMRHTEEWVNADGTYTVVDAYHYDPTRQ